MSVDVLRTVAILDATNYLSGAERMARATESVGDAFSVEKVANALTLAGGLMVGLSAKAVATAASFQQQEKAFEGLLGSAEKGRQLFNDLTKFTVKTPFQLSDWTKASQILLGFGVQAKDLMPILETLGNSEAALGRSGSDLRRAAYELGEMQNGFISMRQVRALIADGVPAAQLLKDQLHLTNDELAKIGEAHIPGWVGVMAIERGIQHGNLANGMAKQMDTLNGKITSLKDNWNLFMAQVGNPALKPLGDLVDKVSDLLGKFQQLPSAEQEAFGKIVLYSGPAILAVGGMIKAWDLLTKAKRDAAKMAKLEREQEEAKIPVANTEATKIGDSTLKWRGLKTELKDIPAILRGIPGKIAASASGVGASISEFGAAGTVGSLAAFTGAVGLLAVEIGGGSIAITNQVNAQRDALLRGYETTDLSFYINRMAADRRRLRANPYDQAAKHDLKTANRAFLIMGGHDERARAAKAAAVARKTPVLDTKAKSADLAAIAHSYLNKKGGSGMSDALAHLIASEDKEETLAAISRLAYEQAHHGRHFIKTAHGKKGFSVVDEGAEAYKAYNVHRLAALGLISQEITALQKQAHAIEHVAGKESKWLALQKQILGLMEKKQGLSEDTIKAKGHKSSLEQIAATIMGGQGLDEAEILRRTGVGRKYFASLNGPGHHLPPNPMAAALSKLAHQPQEIHIHMHNEEGEEKIVVKAENRILKTLADVLTHSGYRPALAGQ